jgi:hypothetical protein
MRIPFMRIPFKIQFRKGPECASPGEAQSPGGEEGFENGVMKMGSTLFSSIFFHRNKKQLF